MTIRKNQYLICLIAMLTLYSCHNHREEFHDITTYLQSNFEFSNNVLKKNRKAYYNLIHDRPSLKIKELNELDAQLDLLIFKIDNSILNNDIDLEKTIAESNQIFSGLQKIISYKKDRSLQKFEQPQASSDELILNYLKNKLVIAMANGFEYANGFTNTGHVFPKGVDSIITSKTENGIKLTLASKLGQSITENRDIVINSIKFNGQEKNLYFKLKDNYAFADIELDSLQTGYYEITGTLKFYDRHGEVRSHFSREFKVD